MGDAHMGLQARLMSQALRKLTSSISRSQTTVAFINQIRMKIGVMFGNPETTTGGNALKFYASVRLDIRRIESIKDGQDVMGSRVRVKVVKNKMAPPFKQAEFDVLFAEGVSKVGELIDLGVDRKIVDKSGAWFSYGGERIGQGREAARDYLKAHPAVAREIEAKIRETAGVGAKAEGHARPGAEKPPGGKRPWPARCSTCMPGFRKKPSPSGFSSPCRAGSATRRGRAAGGRACSGGAGSPPTSARACSESRRTIHDPGW